MNWKIEDAVFLTPLSSLTYYQDDIYSPVVGEEKEKYLQDISMNEQVNNIFITQDNLCIGGNRICEGLIAAGKTHVRAQRVIIEPQYIPLFRKSANNYRHKTKLDDYREVQKILTTIPRHQGKAESTTTSSEETLVLSETNKIEIPVSIQSAEPASTETAETTLSDIPTETSGPSTNRVDITELNPNAAPSQSTLSGGQVDSSTSPKGKTPIQKAVEEADNGMNSSEFQKIKYIEGIDKKYGSTLLDLLNSKCPNVDKIFKAAQEVERRNKQQQNPKPPLEIPLHGRKCFIYNKSSHDMQEIKNNTIDFSFLSHPYWDQIDYNQANRRQLGQEKTVSEFIENLMKIYREVYRKMAPTGNLFVNMKGTFEKNKNHLVEEHFKIAMGKEGWHYEDTFIWLKRGGGKRSGNRSRRPENSYEPIFWFTKTADYYYRSIQIPNKKPITVTFKPAETRIESKGLTCYDKLDVSLPFHSFKNVIEETNFLDVIVTNSAAVDSQFMNKLYGKHPAPFPMSLPLLFLLQFCPPEGRVLEPFLGRGAGLVSPLMLGHTCYGYEIETEYFEQAQMLLADVLKDIDYYRGCMEGVDKMFEEKFMSAA